jgi:hypothetical protein
MLLRQFPPCTYTLRGAQKLRALFLLQSPARDQLFREAIRLLPEDVWVPASKTICGQSPSKVSKTIGEVKCQQMAACPHVTKIRKFIGV